jgi:hypothetical protein
MAQPFACWCGAGEGVCFGRIEGTSKLDVARLEGYWINDYIKEMVLEEEAAKKKKKKKNNNNNNIK